MFCKRCGSSVQDEQCCKPRCLAGRAYLGFKTFCIYCGHQRCRCSQMKYDAATNAWYGVVGTQTILVENKYYQQFDAPNPASWLPYVNGETIRLIPVHASQAA